MVQVGPGLRVSRSIGDEAAAGCGIICDPELIVHRITENDRFMILASEGLWSVRCFRCASHSAVPLTLAAVDSCW
jgi:serine/threonine protein phosphatase PrpC